MFASSHHEQKRDTGKNWEEAAREWNGNDELQARSAKRSAMFDSLGGGLIPLKRRRNNWKRRFDSIGGGLIPPRKRQSRPVGRIHGKSYHRR